MLCKLYTQVGQRVRIRGGSLEGLEGILVGSDHQKLVVSVNLIQQSLALSLEGYDLEPA